MAHSYHPGTFHDYLAYAAVASADDESLGAHHASQGNMPEALRYFARANDTKEIINAGVILAHQGFHDMIGNYGSLAGHLSEVKEFLQHVALVGERLEDRTHNWHMNGMLKASEARRKEIDTR